MNADSMGADAAAHQRLLSSLQDALCRGALPGELEGFDAARSREAAEFIIACAQRRPAGVALVRIESLGGSVGHRRMRIGIVNDDMPFLVDSVSAAVTTRNIVIHRLLHPVISAERDGDNGLLEINPKDGGAALRESIIYMEVDRADARTRHELFADLHKVLSDVRCAVADWRTMQERMKADAALVDEPEGRALLEWFASGALTLLGYQVERPGQPSAGGLGLFRVPSPPEEEGGCGTAIDYFRQGGQVPLLAKAERKSTVHRNVPLDLVAVPIREGGEITAIGVHAGLWTSKALSARVEEVPLLRARLRELEQDCAFDPKGHNGKALRHAFTALPHDLLVNLETHHVRALVMTAMSVADRPRPTLLLVRSTLKGHVFAFVWLPRDDLTTRRRIDIGEMIEKSLSGKLSSWSVALGDGDIALVRYTMVVDRRTAMPDSAELDQRLDAMVRGWEPSVEEALGRMVGTQRAARLAMSLAPRFPVAFRGRYPIEDAAQDIVRLESLEDPAKRSVRIYDLPIDPADRLRLKLYRCGSLVPLSDVVPVLENFGFHVLKETPTRLEGNPVELHIHEFAVGTADGTSATPILSRAKVIEDHITAVLEGRSENDVFNRLVVSVGLAPRDVVLLRAWFRYLRQTGLSYSMSTVVDALRHAPAVTGNILALFNAMHDPALGAGRQAAVGTARAAVEKGLADVAAIDEDRILRLILGVVEATLRTNAFSPASEEALAFKLESARVPGLPQPLPWREIWVYSPRVEGIHLRGGPIARGGLRWSDRRDDFRTEILGLMKAQLVKNAVIVPTGAKGGFYPKHLPPASNRDAWLAEGTESYRIFIRSLLSVTDNIVENKVVHPAQVTIRDGEDPYFVVAADKGTASFSDVANAIALDRGFWLGDAFASGGSNGYDHKAMGITAKGAWVSVQRHFREIGIDVQTQPIRVAGVGDMSGDVFGNGMLLSRAIKLVAAFDHRHIFLDPSPDPAASWEERNRLFGLARSSWADYDTSLLSAGGGIFPRSQKAIPLSPEVRAMLDTQAAEMEPAALIRAILKSQVDLIWFGGIGTYLKASTESHAEAGDPGNDPVRVNAADLRAKSIGEGANLAITQAARIEFAAAGGRVNTDFIDNSAGVDCSDNEVNIKIPLNREMAEGRLGLEERNILLAEMTDEVAGIVLEDNRLQTLALSIAERGGAKALPPLVRAMELLEEEGRLNRQVEGLGTNEDLLRRAQEDRGLTRPELAVLLSSSKMLLQGAIEKSNIADDPTMESELMAAFPPQMQERFGPALRQHRLRREIIATKVANRYVNRLGIIAPFALTEEEGAAFGQSAAAFIAAERLFGMAQLWHALDTQQMPEQVRLELFDAASAGLQLQVADILRCTAPELTPGEIVDLLKPGLGKLDAALHDLLRPEPRADAASLRTRLVALGGPAELVDQIVRLHELNGAVGLANLGQRIRSDEIALTHAYTKLGEALGLDWAQSAANQFEASDQWERLLTAGLARDFEELRLGFLERRAGADPRTQVDQWVAEQGPRIDQFRRTVERARTAPTTTAPMLAQIATQARVLLAR